MVTVTVNNAAALTALEGINPTAISQKMSNAVRRTLEEGKNEARAKIISRYTAKSPLSLGSVRLRTAGLNGHLTFSGKRNPLTKFLINPRRRLNPAPKGGVRVTIVKGAGGSLARAFLWNGNVYERVGKPRLPIRKIGTIALSGMAKAVARQVVKKMENRLERELINL